MLRWNRTEPAPLSYYWSLFANVVVLFIVQAALDESGFVRLLSVVLQGLALLIALQLRPAPRKWQIAGFVVIAIGILGATTTLVANGVETKVATAAMPSGLFAICAVIAIVGAVRQEHEISGRTVLCAVTIYVFVGLTFAYFYRGVEAFNPGAFQTATGELDGAAFQYFSFVTLTTVGFGDITAVDRLPRAIAALEALLGQVYLVTVVALVVGNLGRERLRRPKGGALGESVDE